MHKRRSQTSILLLHDDSIKLLKGKLLIRVSLVQDVRVVHHLRNLLVSHRLPQLLTHPLHLLEVNHPRLVRIVKVEDLQQALLATRIAQLAVDDLQEIIKGDGFALGLQVQDHLEDRLVPLVQSELLQDLLDLLRVDAARALLVEEVKSALQFLKIVSRELLAGRDDHRLRLAGSLGAHSNLTCYNNG